ncbi:pickpocket protein 19 [Drosophila eugracilis]|uniref:pickpocket protein 19 n=1 Tax=Drosophila eugracilis TaxID=29029 RepID=UPI0007E7938D|nr:pickpocket protein 19 [Drosophila eugracilis]
MVENVSAKGNGQKWKERSYGVATHIKDYCTNCTLVGFAYIANSRLHFTERIFWLFCVLISSFGCYHLITEYQRSFPSRAVSIVFESLPPFTKWKFPTVSVCEMAQKNVMFPTIVDYIEGLGVDLNGKYPFDVESAMNVILFPVQYNENAFKTKCAEAVKNCLNPCATCPEGDFRQTLTWYGANCSDLFVECYISGRPFNCCQYFQPLLTPYGQCFLLNSLLNNEPGSKHWLPNQLDPANEKAVVNLVTVMAVQVTLINEEDIPHTALSPTGVQLITPGLSKYIQFNQVEMVNDPDVREVAPQIRSCYFPDENPSSSIYKVYSFSVCISECVRELQMKTCNCTSVFYNPHADPRFPDCDLTGLYCLELARMVRPDSRILNSNNKHFNNESCGCLPSCNQGDIHVVYEPQLMVRNPNKYFNGTLDMPFLPTDQYRRQAIRTRLDVIVSIGGMLGLFLGASLLSAIEFIYYFAVRPFHNKTRARSPRA